MGQESEPEGNEVGRIGLPVNVFSVEPSVPWILSHRPPRKSTKQTHLRLEYSSGKYESKYFSFGEDGVEVSSKL